jgi:hypothetical protein
MQALGGLFGVLSYIAAQRTTEIGIPVLARSALKVVRLMLSDGLQPASVGLILGMAGGVAVAEAVRSLLYGVGPLDAVCLPAS